MKDCQMCPLVSNFPMFLPLQSWFCFVFSCNDGHSSLTMKGVYEPAFRDSKGGWMKGDHLPRAILKGEKPNSLNRRWQLPKGVCVGGVECVWSVCGVGESLGPATAKKESFREVCPGLWTPSGDLRERGSSNAVINKLCTVIGLNLKLLQVRCD